jgi:hypothetical protein
VHVFHESWELLFFGLQPAFRPFFSVSSPASSGALHPRFKSCHYGLDFRLAPWIQLGPPDAADGWFSGVQDAPSG